MSDRSSEPEVPATGLLPETPEGQQHREPSARERMMESIVAKVNRQREEELGHTLPDVGPTLEESTSSRPLNQSLGEREEDRAYVSPFADDGDADEPEAAPAAKPAAPAEPAPAAPVAPAHQELITVNVGGQNLQVTQDQLVQLAQIGMIANHTVAEYQRSQEQPNFYQQQPAPQQRQQAATQQPVVDQERVRETVKRIQYGSEEDAATAMADLIGSVRLPAGPQVDPVAIQRGATMEAMRLMRLQADTEVIRREYPDIMSNPDLSDLAAKHVVRLRDQLARLGQNASDLEVYREAGNRVLDLIGKPRPGAPDAGQTANRPDNQTASQASGNVVVRPRSTADARKREAPRSTSQVIDRRSEVPPGPRAPTPSDVVDMYRKQRGQSPLR